MIWRVISIADIMPKKRNTWNLINSHGRCDVYPISRKCTAEIKCIRGLNQKVFISITEAARPTTCGSLFSLDVKLFQKARFNNVTFLITTRKRGCQSSSFLSCEMLSVVIRVILWWQTLFFLFSLFFFPTNRNTIWIQLYIPLFIKAWINMTGSFVWGAFNMAQRTLLCHSNRPQLIYLSDAGFLAL